MVDATTKTGPASLPGAAEEAATLTAALAKIRALKDAQTTAADIDAKKFNGFLRTKLVGLEKQVADRLNAVNSAITSSKGYKIKDGVKFLGDFEQSMKQFMPSLHSFKGADNWTSQSETVRSYIGHSVHAIIADITPGFITLNDIYKSGPTKTPPQAEPGPVEEPKGPKANPRTVTPEAALKHALRIERRELLSILATFDDSRLRHAISSDHDRVIGKLKDRLAVVMKSTNRPGDANVYDLAAGKALFAEVQNDLEKARDALAAKTEKTAQEVSNERQNTLFLAAVIESRAKIDALSIPTNEGPKVEEPKGPEADETTGPASAGAKGVALLGQFRAAAKNFNARDFGAKVLQTVKSEEFRYAAATGFTVKAGFALAALVLTAPVASGFALAVASGTIVALSNELRKQRKATKLALANGETVATLLTLGNFKNAFATQNIVTGLKTVAWTATKGVIGASVGYGVAAGFNSVLHGIFGHHTLVGKGNGSPTHTPAPAAQPAATGTAPGTASSAGNWGADAVPHPPADTTAPYAQPTTGAGTTTAPGAGTTPQAPTGAGTTTQTPGAGTQAPIPPVQPDLVWNEDLLDRFKEIKSPENWNLLSKKVQDSVNYAIAHPGNYKALSRALHNAAGDGEWGGLGNANPTEAIKILGTHRTLGMAHPNLFGDSDINYRMSRRDMVDILRKNWGGARQVLGL